MVIFGVKIGKKFAKYQSKARHPKTQKREK